MPTVLEQRDRVGGRAGQGRSQLLQRRDGWATEEALCQGLTPLPLSFPDP